MRDSPGLTPSETAERLVSGNLMGLLGAVGTVVVVEVLDRVAGYLEPGQAAIVAEVLEEDWMLTDSRLEAVGGRAYRSAASLAVDDQIRRDFADIGARIARLGAECERARDEVDASVRARVGAARSVFSKARDRVAE